MSLGFVTCLNHVAWLWEGSCKALLLVMGQQQGDPSHSLASLLAPEWELLVHLLLVCLCDL